MNLSEPTFTLSLKGIMVARILYHAVKQMETFILHDYREWDSSQHCVNECRVHYLIISSAIVIVWILLKRSIHVKEHVDSNTSPPIVWKTLYIKWRSKVRNIYLWCPWPMGWTRARVVITSHITQYLYSCELVMYSRRNLTDTLKILYCFHCCLFQCIPRLPGVVPSYIGEKSFSFKQCFT